MEINKREIFTRDFTWLKFGMFKLVFRVLDFSGTRFQCCEGKRRKVKMQELNYTAFLFEKKECKEFIFPKQSVTHHYTCPGSFCCRDGSTLNLYNFSLSMSHKLKVVLLTVWQPVKA